MLAINDENRVFIRRKSTHNYNRVINLMLITGENSFKCHLDKHTWKHYVAVKLLSRLLAKKNTKHESVQYHYTNCLHGFPSEISKDKHEGYCKANKAVRIEMPSWKPYVEYSNGQYQLKVPFMMYADFESLLVKPPEGEEGVVNAREPLGWCVKSEFVHGEVSNPIKLYRGKDCIEKFCQHIVCEAKRLYNSFPEVPMIPMTKKQRRQHSRARVCHIWLNQFKPNDMKVRDHCHYTDEYRGAAHSLCILQFKFLVIFQ